jgi:hypothetical protein
MLKMNKSPEWMERKNTPTLTLQKRDGTLSIDELRTLVESFGVPKTQRAAILGLLFLWHDHWAEAHAAAHEGEGSADYDLLHSLVHRR